MIVVVGASLAGLRAAETLRMEGYDGEVLVVGEELPKPYDRPPLSKRLLSGALQPEDLTLQSAEPGGIAGLDIDWRLGSRAVSLDVKRSALALEDGSSVRYSGLVVATGATPIRPDGWDADGVHVLRTLQNGLLLKQELAAGPRRVVVVGAGFIGAEVAATCRGLGLDVTVLDGLSAPMVRALGPAMGRVVADVHRAHGVDLRMSTTVDHLIVDGANRIAGVQTSRGDSIEADVVVLGLGVRPNTGWIESSQLAIDSGVVCDATCLAAPRVVAAGDVASWHHARWGEQVRIEHWDNAQEMGAHAARTLLANMRGQSGDAYLPVPWFWSDQFDRRLHLTGRPTPDAAVRIVEGSVDEGKFVALYLAAGRVRAAFGMNSPGSILRWRKQLSSEVAWPESAVV